MKENIKKDIIKIHRSKVYDVDIEDINIKLSIDLDDLSNSNDNNGYIQITNVHTSNKNYCFWDNLNFFIYNNKELIEEKCKEETISKNLYVKEIFDIIKKLIDVAIQEKMLFNNDRI